MIQLTKAGKPAVLSDKEEVWKAEYQQYLIDPQSVPANARYRYRHPDIKQTLRAETFDKCAYCEAKISHVYPGQTDHIAPVSKRPDLIVTWENLAYVCEECNRPKSNYYNEMYPLVNPYKDDPRDHVGFYGNLPIHHDAKGHLTVSQVSLDRPGLLERRKERIEFVTQMVDNWRKSEGPEKELIKGEILELAEPASEYSATVRAFLWQHLGWEECR